MADQRRLVLSCRGERGNNTLENAKQVREKRYGPSSGIVELSRKAQLAYYEDTRAKYEAYATHSLFPHEAHALDARFDGSRLAGQTPSLRLEGYDVLKQVVALTKGTRQ